MKRTLKTIATIGTMIILLGGAYLIGTTQADTVTVEKKIVKTVKVVPDGYINTDTYDFYNNYVDMREVIDFDATDTGLIIYINDGSSYYWER